MSNYQKILCAVEVSVDYKAREEAQFKPVRMKFYSGDTLSAHGFLVPTDVLKAYAPTVRGKPILAYYNAYADGGNGDLAGHEDNSLAKEHPIGFIPQDAEITYDSDDRGALFAYVDGYIWSVYYPQVINIFARAGGTKGLSSEMLIYKTEAGENGIQIVKEFSIAGITVLGKTDAFGFPIEPAVEGCTAEMLFNAARAKFEKEVATMGGDENNSAVDNAVVETSTRLEVSTTTDTYDDDGRYVGSTHEAHTVGARKVEYIPEDEEAQATENQALVERCAALEADLAAANERIEALVAENAVLTEYKNAHEQAAITAQVDAVLNSVSSVLTSDQIADWRVKGLACNAENLPGWTNSVKALAFDATASKGGSQPDMLRCAIPVDIEKKPVTTGDLFVDLRNKYNI